MKYLIETDRLRLRTLTLEDTTFIIELLNSPGWLQFIGDRNVKTEIQAKNYLQDGPFKSYAENGFGLWLVEKKEDNQPMGMCGFLKRDYLETPDIGFAFLPYFNGKGYAYEMASATLVYAKHQLKVSKISAITLPDNEKSIRLLEKIGLKFIKTIYLAPDKEELLLYGN